MRFEQFSRHVGHLGVFESSLVYPFYASPQQAQRQLSDWTRVGKLLKLRRGVYALAARSERPLRYVVANRLVHSSYVSLQSALSYYSMIPEHVAMVTSVTTGRPTTFTNDLGRFLYRHIKTTFFYGFRYQRISNTQFAFVATPEKALLDLIYLTPNGDNEAYIRELRLQNLEIVDPDRLHQLVERSRQPKLKRALPDLLAEVQADTDGWVAL